MAEPEAAFEREGRALDLKAAAGAQFAREADVEMARKGRAAQQFAESENLGEIRLRLVEPVEIIGDREMLGHVALPGRHRAAIGLDPVLHEMWLRAVGWVE